MGSDDAPNEYFMHVPLVTVQPPPRSVGLGTSVASVSLWGDGVAVRSRWLKVAGVPRSMLWERWLPSALDGAPGEAVRTGVRGAGRGGFPEHGGQGSWGQLAPTPGSCLLLRCWGSAGGPSRWSFMELLRDHS